MGVAPSAFCHAACQDPGPEVTYTGRRRGGEWNQRLDGKAEDLLIFGRPSRQFLSGAGGTRSVSALSAAAIVAAAERLNSGQPLSEWKDPHVAAAGAGHGGGAAAQAANPFATVESRSAEGMYEEDFPRRHGEGGPYAHGRSPSQDSARQAAEQRLSPRQQRKTSQEFPMQQRRSSQEFSSQQQMLRKSSREQQQQLLQQQQQHLMLQQQQKQQQLERQLQEQQMRQQQEWEQQQQLLQQQQLQEWEQQQQQLQQQRLQQQQEWERQQQELQRQQQLLEQQLQQESEQQQQRLLEQQRQHQLEWERQQQQLQLQQQELEQQQQQKQLQQQKEWEHQQQLLQQQQKQLELEHQQEEQRKQQLLQQQQQLQHQQQLQQQQQQQLQQAQQHLQQQAEAAHNAPLYSLTDIQNMQTRCKPGEFAVVLEKKAQVKQPVGLKVVPVNGINLRVASLSEGLLMEWNRTHPQWEVKANDLITEVNDSRDNTTAMLNHIRTARILILHVMRPPPTPKRAAEQ